VAQCFCREAASPSERKDRVDASIAKPSVEKAPVETANDQGSPEEQPQVERLGSKLGELDWLVNWARSRAGDPNRAPLDRSQSYPGGASGGDRESAWDGSRRKKGFRGRLTNLPSVFSTELAMIRTESEMTQKSV
jgi:hypothetical protein